jgi:hypothetical protein
MGREGVKREGKGAGLSRFSGKEGSKPGVQKKERGLKSGKRRGSLLQASI